MPLQVSNLDAAARFAGAFGAKEAQEERVGAYKPPAVEQRVEAAHKVLGVREGASRAGGGAPRWASEFLAPETYSPEGAPTAAQMTTKHSRSADKLLAEGQRFGAGGEPRLAAPSQTADAGCCILGSGS